MKIDYCRHQRFEKQIKKLLKRFKTLEDDLEIAKIAAIELLHLRKINSRSVWLVPGFDLVGLQIYKVKKFACKSLAGKGVRSGIRAIYAFYPQKMRIEFLEIYYKEKSDDDMDYDFAKSYLAENGK